MSLRTYYLYDLSLWFKSLYGFQPSVDLNFLFFTYISISQGIGIIEKKNINIAEEFKNFGKVYIEKLKKYL